MPPLPMPPNTPGVALYGVAVVVVDDDGIVLPVVVDDVLPVEGVVAVGEVLPALVAVEG